MASPVKKITTNNFSEGRNTDIADQALSNTQFRKMLNGRIFGLGTKSIAENILGTTLIDATLPAGDNFCIGAKSDEENNCFYYCVWNSNLYHTIFKYNSLTHDNLVVFQNLTDTGAIDVLKWDKAKEHWLLHIDIVNVNLWYSVDNLNKALKFNINKAMDKSAAGYGFSIPADFITAYKKTFLYAPKCVYVTDPARNSNNLYGNLFKFSARPQYDDKEFGNWCDFSTVAKPGDQSTTGLSNITFAFNCIEVTVQTGNKLTEKIQIAVKVNNTSAATGTILSTDFVICAVLNKAELGIANNSSYIYKFYNDGAYTETNQNDINRIYSSLPRVPACQSFVKSAITYTGFKEGWETVLVNASVTQRLDDLYLSSNTQNQQTTASLNITEISVEKVHPIFSKSRYDNITKFTIGVQVKKGNIFEIFGQNGGKDNYHFVITATGSDTASTITNKIKSILRGIGRGYPTNGTQITNEGSDTAGNSYFNYGYLGEYGESKTTWTVNVTQVSYTSLKDNGASLQIIPYGSITNYGIVYIDDDGRESLVYTSISCVVRTPYITEIGYYKKPIHIIAINHVPPLAAKYWRLVRTKQNHGIEILIQKVINITTDNTSAYLDLVVGSLLTYQELHKNTILQYEFKAGDRLRLIKNVNTSVLYPGYTETEVLGYRAEQSDIINQNVYLHSNDLVTINGIASADNIGKVISINGSERTIIASNNGEYRVDSPYGTIETYPNFTLIDRRGIIRIKKPTIEVADNSLVELFTPQATAVNSDYKLFQDFGQKFEIIGYGTPSRFHAGSTQNQTRNQSAIIEVDTGDAYIRDRELPVTNIVPGTQVLVSKVVDANYSDFYKSDMTDLGRVYPQDDGKGIVDFGDRTRFSGNYISDTNINGLNDFNNLDRVDNKDSYGRAKLTKFFNNRLYYFKVLKDTFIPVSHTLSTDGSGNVLNIQSGKLLNEMQYFAWEGGIGNNPESWFYEGNCQYHASINSSAFLRIGGEGVEPISTLFGFDKEGRDILAIVDKYNLPLIGEFYRKYDEAIWSFPPHIEYLYNGLFDFAAWRLSSDLLPNDTVYEVTQQPSTGNVTWDNTLKTFVVTDTILGDDFFVYKPIGGIIKKMCFTTVQPANRATAWRAKVATVYCQQAFYTPATITMNLTEQGDINSTTPPFSDGNVLTKDNDIQVGTRLVNNGTDVSYVKPGHKVTIDAFVELASNGSNPVLSMNIHKNGQQLTGWPQSIAGIPGNNIIFTDIVADSDQYIADVTAVASPSTPPPQ